MNLNQYFEKTNLNSAFTASISEIGGNITFSNSGKRGSIKQFTLGLESFISMLKDIEENLVLFNSNENYIEKNWRDLGSEYYSDGPANAMSTVQTKPLFSTLSKIIAWANQPDLDQLDFNQQIRITKEFIKNAITKMEELAQTFRSSEPIDLKSIVLKFKDLTFQNINDKYETYAEEIFEENKKWMVNVEDKLSLINKEFDQEAVKNIIDKLKRPEYVFTDSDQENLAIFTRVIDKTLNVSNFINNFTLRNLEKNGITIFDIFNKIKSSERYNDFIKEVKLSGTLKINIPYLYSAIKYCQSPEDYPVFYKYWYTLLEYVLDKGNSYDELTDFYRTFPKKNRLLNFCTYFGVLGKAILYELKHHLVIVDKKSKDYQRIFKLIPSKLYISQVFGLKQIEDNFDASFNSTDFLESCLKVAYILNENVCVRFISSLLAKPFIILTGLSGSGKTKLAQAFAYWISGEDNQYCIIPVGADWTNREPLLGFPNSLEQGYYIKPENKVIDLIIEAGKEENADKPFFLILDEMNLSHVERYFADFLSVMESDETINLHSDIEWKDETPAELKLPKNLFIIGTVNVDETTYMFSPKVLDRAHVIEFRVDDKEMESFLKGPLKPDLNLLKGMGKETASDFILKSGTEISEFEELSEIQTVLLEFFKELKKIGAEFGYRTASEIYRFAGILKMLTKENGNEWSIDDIVDACVIQKLLPKVHGSRSKVEPVLKTLAALCYKDKESFDVKVKMEDMNFTNRDKIKYPLSLEKIIRMRIRVVQDGFTSFTEA